MLVKLTNTCTTTCTKLLKGNTFKHKRSLVEHIIAAKAEALREKALKEEAEARRVRNRAARERRQQRLAEKKKLYLLKPPTKFESVTRLIKGCIAFISFMF